MKRISPSLALVALVLASPALATGLDGLDIVAADDMGRLRGGTETAPDAIQGNTSTTDQTNVNGGTVISGHSSKLNGAIGSATITGNHGIVSQMINSGDNNIMNAGTNINIYMK